MSCCDGIRLDGRSLALLEHVLVLRGASRQRHFPSTEEFRWPRPSPTNSLRRGSWCATGLPGPARRQRSAISSRVSRSLAAGLRGLAGLGLFGVAVPEDFGGAGGSIEDLSAMVEEAAKALVPGPVATTAGHAGGLRSAAARRLSPSGDAPPGWHSTAMSSSTRWPRGSRAPCRGCWAASPTVCCWCRPAEKWLLVDSAAADARRGRRAAAGHRLLPAVGAGGADLGSGQRAGRRSGLGDDLAATCCPPKRRGSPVGRWTPPSPTPGA